MLLAFHLPQIETPAELPVVLRGDGIDAVAPTLAADDVATICQRLRDAQRTLAQLPVARVIAAVDVAARRIRALAAAADDELVRAVAAFTGYSAPMTLHVLERISADWLRAPLVQLIDAELGGADAVDGFVQRAPGLRSRALGAPLSLHVFAGNVPGVSITSIVRALLVKGAVLGKVAAGEPVLAPLFARELYMADPDIGACVAVTYWRGGLASIEEAALGRVDAVVHYGGPQAVASLRARVPANVRFIEHGPRLSFALVNGAVLDDDGPRIAAELARAMSLFDQQGCVSPQTVWLVGADADAGRRFAALVADAAAALERELPRGRIGAREAAAIHELRAAAEFRAIAGEAVVLWEGERLGWTIVLDPVPAFGGSCLNRSLVIRQADSIEQVVALMRPFGALVQTAGVAGFEGTALERVAQALGDAGAARVASIAAMPWPHPAWHHDGRGPLTELVRWLDLEEPA